MGDKSKNREHKKETKRCVDENKERKAVTVVCILGCMHIPSLRVFTFNQTPHGQYMSNKMQMSNATLDRFLYHFFVTVQAGSCTIRYTVIERAFCISSQLCCFRVVQLFSAFYRYCQM